MNQTFTIACYNRKPVTRNRVASQKVLSLLNVTGTNRHKPSCNCQSANWIQLIYKSWNVILGSKGKVTLFEIKDLWHLVLEHASQSQHDYLPVSPEKQPLKLMIEQNRNVACIGSTLSCEYNTSGTQTAPCERGLRKPGFNSSIKWSTYKYQPSVFESMPSFQQTSSSLCWYTPKVYHGSPENYAFQVPNLLFLFPNFQLLHHVGVGPIHWKHRHPLNGFPSLQPLQLGPESNQHREEGLQGGGWSNIRKANTQLGKSPIPFGMFFPNWEISSKVAEYLAWKWFGNQQKHQKNTNTKKLYQWFQHLNWWPPSLKPPTTRWIRLILHTWF